MHTRFILVTRNLVENHSFLPLKVASIESWNHHITEQGYRSLKVFRKYPQVVVGSLQVGIAVLFSSNASLVGLVGSRVLC